MRFTKPIVFIVVIAAVAYYVFRKTNILPQHYQGQRKSKVSSDNRSQLTANDFSFSGIGNLRAITNILEKLRSNPSDPDSRLKLLKHIQEADENQGSREILSGLKSVYSLVQVGVGGKYGFSFCESVRINYADTRFASMVEPSEFNSPCNKCSGKGGFPDVCETCYGNGGCNTCMGKGSRTVNQRAPQTLQKKFVKRKLGDSPATVTVNEKCYGCDGSGLCASCKGTGRRVVSCRDCSGSGQILSKIKVKALFDSCLERTLELLVERENAGAGLAMKEEVDDLSNLIENDKTQEKGL